MKNLLKRKYSLGKDVHKALNLLDKLFALKVVRVVIILAFITLLAPLVLFYFLRPTVNHDIEYGVTFSNKYAEEIGLDWKDTYIKILDDLGPKNLRLIAYWDDIESNRDQFNHSDIWWQLEEAQKRDVNVILVVGRKVPRWPECFEPQWWKEIEDESIKEQELYEFVKRTVADLKHFDNIKMWQVENEPFWPFGICIPEIKRETVKQEVKIVREQDDRPIIIQDSGEGGYWLPTYKLGDYLAISMYRKIWYDFWGIFLGKPIYFKYPLAHWTYKIKADLVHVPYEKVIVTELQGEPWGPVINTELTEEQKNKTMSRNDFLDTISYSQKSGFKEIYIWGAEWWFWEKEHNNNGFYWDTARALFN